MKQNNKYYQKISVDEFDKFYHSCPALPSMGYDLDQIDFFTWYELEWLSKLPFYESKDLNVYAIFGTEFDGVSDSTARSNFWKVDWSAECEPLPTNWRQSQMLFYKLGEKIMPLVSVVTLNSLRNGENSIKYMRIVKGSDDYFCIQIRYPHSHLRKGYVIAKETDYDYYKCDGFTAVKKLIYDKLLYE